MKSRILFSLILASLVTTRALAQTIRITDSAPSPSGLLEERFIGDTARPEWTNGGAFLEKAFPSY